MKNNPWSDENREEIVMFGMDRSLVRPCAPCRVVVSDLRQYQCAYCLCQYDARSALVELKDEHDGDEKEALLALQALKRVRLCLARGSWNQLRGLYYGYRDEKGMFITDRHFYELKN